MLVIAVGLLIYFRYVNKEAGNQVLDYVRKACGKLRAGDNSKDSKDSKDNEDSKDSKAAS